MSRLISMIAEDGQTIKTDPPFHSLVAFIHPITIILKDDLPWWEMEKNFVQDGNYDYMMLHEVNLILTNEHLSKDQQRKAQSRQIPFCFDGAFAIPTDECFKPIENAVSVFNGILGDMLLGGLYCEPVSARDICTGAMYGAVEASKPDDSKADVIFMRIHNSNRDSHSHIHFRLRIKSANVEDRIDFRNCRQLHASTLKQIIAQGSRIRKNVPELSSRYLLHGITAMARHDWTSALASIWIAVEQVTSNIWTNRILTRHSARHPAKPNHPTRDRRDFFNSHDAWTRSLQHELLYQREVIDDDLLEQLVVARKARNGLSHRGETPPREVTKAAYQAFLGLLRIALDDENKQLIANLERYSQYIIEDPFDIPRNPPGPITDFEAANRSWYRPVRPLPGERGLWAVKDPGVPQHIDPSFVRVSDPPAK